MTQPFHIEHLPAFSVAGYKMRTTNRKREGTKKIPEFWNRIMQEGKQDVLLQRMNQAPYGLLGISVYRVDEKDARIFDYYIACSSSHPIKGELDTYTVPEADWAVFPCTKKDMGKVQVQAIMKWLPKSGYHPLNSGYITGRMKSAAPDIECYKENDSAELWIAVKEK